MRDANQNGELNEFMESQRFVFKKKRIGEVKSIKKTFKTQFFLCSYFSYTRLNGKVP